MAPLDRGGWLRLLKSFPAAGAAIAVVTTLVAPAALAPAISRDFPDPTVLAAGGSYYAYSTASGYRGGVRHVPVQRAGSLRGDWTELGDAMPELPEWVAKDAAGRGSVWAPEVAARSDGSYLLYFTARSGARNVQCIGAAVAASPRGPFKPVKDPMVCRPEEVDSIDPKAFSDVDGAQYLLYTSGRGATTIWAQRVSRDGLAPVGERRMLIRADRPEEANIVEAPALVRHGGKYVLFYSGNAYNSGRYFVNYATAESLAGPFVKSERMTLLDGNNVGGGLTNPGGQDVVPGGKQDYLLFHAYATPGQRSMYVVGLTWDGATPKLQLDDDVRAFTRPAPGADDPPVPVQRRGARSADGQ